MPIWVQKRASCLVKCDTKAMPAGHKAKPNVKPIVGTSICVKETSLALFKLIIQPPIKANKVMLSASTTG